MEKASLLKVYLYYFILFVVVILSNYLSINVINGRVAIGIAVIWMILTIVIYFLFIRKTNHRFGITLYTILNAIIGGITISAYYSMRNVTPYNTILLVSLFGAIMIINYCLMSVTRRRLAVTRGNLVLTIIFILLSIYIWAERNTSFGSSLVFLMVVYLCFSIALHQVVKRSLEWSSIIPYASLLMFGGLFLVVIVLLTDGDALDALDAGFLEESKKKRI